MVIVGISLQVRRWRSEELGLRHGKWGWGQDSGPQSDDDSRKKQLTLSFGYQTDHKAGLAGKGEEAAGRTGTGWGHRGGWTLPPGPP